MPLKSSGVSASRWNVRSPAQIRGQSVDECSPLCHPVPVMGRWPFDAWQSGSALRRQFAVLSFAVIALITVALSVAVTSALRRDLLDREWGTTADYIRTVTLQHLAPSDFTDSARHASNTRFEVFYEQAVTMPEIVRVKIYDADMRVVWSDEPRLVGQRFENNPHLVHALTGRTVVNLEGDERKEENRYEGSEFSRLVEVYVPVVFPGSSRVVGVVETYKVPARVFASIRTARFTVVGATVAGGLLLYVALFWIVRRASRRIDEQHQSLEHRGRELARANEELKAVQGQLLEAERLAAIGEVVTAVAHGIRNPLANIRAAAQVAGLGPREVGSTLPTAKHLANIMAEVDRLEGRLKELLRFVRPAERENSRVDVNAVVREAAHMVSGRMTAARIASREALAPGLPVIDGNPMLLEQVVLSLLANAVEAMPNGGGQIAITTGETQMESGAPAVFLEVSDNGVGIPAESLAKLFTPFYTTKAQGTGLGLAIAKKFTEAHGGTIAVSSRPGAGTTFRVILPAHREA